MEVALRGSPIPRSVRTACRPPAQVRCGSVTLELGSSAARWNVEAGRRGHAQGLDRVIFPGKDAHLRRSRSEICLEDTST